VFIAARNAFNRQVRKGSLEIPGCVGCIDWGQAVEMDPAAGDNRWQSGLTMDGIHPSAKGYQVMERVAANALRDLRPQLTR
jgi:lysophospholipase L1-like esterase